MPDIRSLLLLPSRLRTTKNSQNHPQTHAQALYSLRPIPLEKCLQVLLRALHHFLERSMLSHNHYFILRYLEHSCKIRRSYTISQNRLSRKNYPVSVSRPNSSSHASPLLVQDKQTCLTKTSQRFKVEQTKVAAIISWYTLQHWICEAGSCHSIENATRYQNSWQRFASILPPLDKSSGIQRLDISILNAKK